MRRAIHIITGLGLFLLLIGQGVFIFYATYFDRPLWERLLDRCRAEPECAFVGSIVLLAVILLYLISGIPRRRGEPFLTFRGEGGRVSISVKAVSDFLARLDDEFAAILSLKPTLQPRRGSLDVILDIKVRAGTQIPELTRMLQDRVRESIRENLGLADVRSVKVNVRDIIGAIPPPDPLREELGE